MIDTAFHLLELLNEDYWQWVEETRQQVDIAIAELEDGQGLDGETVMTDLLAKFSRR